MKCKLFPNMKRLTTGFSIGILCVTLSVLTLRLTVFSDMAATPEGLSNIYSSEDGAFEINKKIYFSSATGKGDLSLRNLSDEHLIRVNITLADSGKSILSTGFVNAGASVRSMPMNPDGQALAEDVYNCIASVSAYAPDDVRTPVGSAQTEIQIYIGERPDK